MKIKLLGFDLAKNVFQICALNQASPCRMRGSGEMKGFNPYY